MVKQRWRSPSTVSPRNGTTGSKISTELIPAWMQPVLTWEADSPIAGAHVLRYWWTVSGFQGDLGKTTYALAAGEKKSLGNSSQALGLESGGKTHVNRSRCFCSCMSLGRTGWWRRGCFMCLGLPLNSTKPHLLFCSGAYIRENLFWIYLGNPKYFIGTV